jgi:ketosteroid isomerase-like protein
MSTRPEIIERLVAAGNAHDIDGLVECFSPSYVNVTPAHPARGFRGKEQVRRNWTSIFAAVPDIATRVVDCVVKDGQVWTEWEMRGSRGDGKPHAMVGVIIFGVEDDRIVSARFYLEPVETTSGDADSALQRLIEEPRP